MSILQLLRCAGRSPGTQSVRCRRPAAHCQLAQYSRRLQALGLLPFFLIFIVLVAALLKMGLLKGWDLIIDSSLLAAWSPDEPDGAWSWPASWKARIFGYKVHTILCRWSYLPLLRVVIPANHNDGPLAIPMFTAFVAAAIDRSESNTKTTPPKKKQS